MYFSTNKLFPFRTGDGTFKVAPKTKTDKFSQLYVIGGLYKQHHLPLVYALLMDKAEETYSALFGGLSALMAEQEAVVKTKVLITDFESGVLAAAATALPNVQHAGCFFHLGQALWRHIQQAGLAETYKTERDFRIDINKLLALAFCRVEDVPEAFQDLLLGGPAAARDVYFYWR